MVAVAIRGSHVTTLGVRFCGDCFAPHEANGGAFGSELLTGRQTHANIILSKFELFNFGGVTLKFNFYSIYRHKHNNIFN